MHCASFKLELIRPGLHTLASPSLPLARALQQFVALIVCCISAWMYYHESLAAGVTALSLLESYIGHHTGTHLGNIRCNWFLGYLVAGLESCALPTKTSSSHR